jgi:hypothetical protein
MKYLRKLKFGLIGLAFLAVFTLFTMILWNDLIPDLFKGPTITYFQALGLLVLAKILFVVGPGRRPPFMRGHHDYWRKRMEEKWEKMTPEEREKWKKECGGPWKYFAQDKESENPSNSVKTA